DGSDRSARDSGRRADPASCQRNLRSICGAFAGPVFATKRHTNHKMKLAFVLNEKPTEVDFEPQETLAEVLRNRCHLTGLKFSCEVQVCGACTALVDGLPVSACTYLAYEARGRRVTTIEGLSSGERLHPVQQAFLDEFAFQCGFCTPGMILAAKSLLDESPE